MSTDYTAWVAVGFRINAEELISLKRILPEESHMEPRFDSKTGVSLPAERVIDAEERVVFVLGDREFELFSEFCWALAKKIKCGVHLVDSTELDAPGEAILGPNFKCGPRQSIHPHFDIGGDVKYGAIARMGPELARIKRALREFRILTKDPIIGLCWSAG